MQRVVNVVLLCFDVRHIHGQEAAHIQWLVVDALRVHEHHLIAVDSMRLIELLVPLAVLPGS